MKRIQIFAGVFAATVLLFSSCSKEEATIGGGLDGKRDIILTFNLRTPVGEKVVYTKATHDESEYAIKSLTLYEYGVSNPQVTQLKRVLKYAEGGADNTLDLIPGSDGLYTFSVKVPLENMGEKYTYKFVANETPDDPDLDSSFDIFKIKPAQKTLSDGSSADLLAETNKGIVMSGTAKDEQRNEVLTIDKNLICKVQMERIVSRIDVKYETPNLKITKMELQHAAESGFLFPSDAVASSPTQNYITLGMNKNVSLPTDYLKNGDETSVELKKAFYSYERINSEDATMRVHIEYNVLGASGKEYNGSVDVPFKKVDGEFVNTERNHLYTIVLGNANEPASDKVQAKLIVDEWNTVDMDEPLIEDEL